MEEKICNKCKELKSLEEYHNNSKSKDGKTYWCKICSGISAKESAKKNKDHINTRRRVRRSEDEDYRIKVNLQKMKSYWDNKAKSLYQQARSRSKRLGIGFNIDLQDVIIPNTCPIMNKPFDRGRYSASLDRIDNSKGYVKDNIWIISRVANRMKNDGTTEELLQFCDNIKQFLINMR